MKTILTENLTLADLPTKDSSLRKINEFALSISQNELGDEVINFSLQSDFDTLTIKDLRAVLYIEQRRWNHFGEKYDSTTESRIRELISKIWDNFGTQ